MRAARPPPFPHSSRGAHGAVRVHRGLVQPPSPPLRSRLSVANQLRKEPRPRAVNRKPSAVHSTGVTPAALVVVLNYRERRECISSNVVQNTENNLRVSYPLTPGVGLIRVFIGIPADCHRSNDSQGEASPKQFVCEVPFRKLVFAHRLPLLRSLPW